MSCSYIFKCIGSSLSYGCSVNFNIADFISIICRDRECCTFPSVKDVGIDSIGVLFGITFVRLFCWIALGGNTKKRKRRRRRYYY